ncbi:MAG: hypothetical protein ACKO3N_13590 [Verrucomicrobiota bacterium]
MPATLLHRERRLEGRRDFQLHGDRLEVVGREYLGGEYRQTFERSSLKARPDTMTSRGRLLKQALWLMLGGAVLNRLEVKELGLGWTLVLVGALVAAVSLRQIRWVVFKPRTGGEPVALADVGPDRLAFPAFVEELQRRIEAQPPGTPAAPPAA